jgi:hypothetical protein
MINIKFLSFIYINFISKIRFLKYSINIYIAYDIYKNRINYGNNILNFILNTKIKLRTIINDLYKKNEPEYKLINAELYKDLTNKIEITNYFTDKKINVINDNLIEQLFIKYNLEYVANKDIRLKIHFIFHNKNYILYYSHNRLYNNYNKIKYEIPYPPYSNEILSDYRKDIIKPNYVISSKKNLLYSLFNMESKDIDYVELNDHTKDIHEYVNMIHTPLNDFGLLYCCPVKLSWLLYENNIDIKNFKSFLIKFVIMYFDEEKIDLLEHKINLTIDDIDNIIISERMKFILSEKDKEIILN